MFENKRLKPDQVLFAISAKRDAVMDMIQRDRCSIIKPIRDYLFNQCWEGKKLKMWNVEVVLV